MSRGLVWRTLRAPTYRQGKISVTPIARVVGLRWRWGNRIGGQLWLFPAAVEVQRHDKQEDKPTRLPIINITTVALIILFLAGTLLALVSLRAQSRRRSKEHAIRN